MLNEWKPIATAPLDGSYVLLGRPGYVDAGQRSWGEWWDTRGALIDPKPTHWMPLPEPPTE